MVWQKRIRFVAWVCFLLLWIPFGFLIFSAVTGADEPPVAAIVLFVFLCVLFAGLIAASFATGTRGEETITRPGIPAEAIVLSVSDTGTMINSLPQLRIELEVRPPSGSRFRTTLLQAVPYSFIPQVQPGRPVRVLYSRDTKEVALDCS